MTIKTEDKIYKIANKQSILHAQADLFKWETKEEKREHIYKGKISLHISDMTKKPSIYAYGNIDKARAKDIFSSILNGTFLTDYPKGDTINGGGKSPGGDVMARVVSITVSRPEEMQYCVNIAYGKAKIGKTGTYEMIKRDGQASKYITHIEMRKMAREILDYIACAEQKAMFEGKPLVTIMERDVSAKKQAETSADGPTEVAPEKKVQATEKKVEQKKTQKTKSSVASKLKKYENIQLTSLTDEMLRKLKIVAESEQTNIAESLLCRIEIEEIKRAN